MDTILLYLATTMRSALTVAIGLGSAILIDSAYAVSGWTDSAVVEELRVSAGHYYAVRLDIKENPSGCRDKRWFFQDYGTPGSEKMFDILLEGLKPAHPVRIYVTGKCNLDGYAEFRGVTVGR